MQTVDQKGILGKVEEFDAKKLADHLKNPNIEHVDVFKGTKENINARKNLEGRKFNHKLSRGFKKAPSIK